jgi:rhodanese-related sulfurtransferase
VGPHELDDIRAQGGLLIDIRPAAQRAKEGELPGAIRVERNVLEWRLDPVGEHRLPEVTGYGQPVVVICSEGYASSLAAASLADLGYEWAADLIGGYRAWNSWFESEPRSLNQATASADRTSS